MTEYAAAKTPQEANVAITMENERLKAMLKKVCAEIAELKAELRDDLK